MFTANQNKGFNITFPNGWTVSVQFGPRNYCDHYDTEADLDAPSKVEVWKATTAEVAAWAEHKVWHNFNVDFPDEMVKGYMTPEEVLEFINLIANKKGPEFGMPSTYKSPNEEN